VIEVNERTHTAMVTNIHHVGIAVRSLSQAYRFWRDTLGLPLTREAKGA